MQKKTVHNVWRICELLTSSIGHCAPYCVTRWTRIKSNPAVTRLRQRQLILGREGGQLNTSAMCCCPVSLSASTNSFESCLCVLCEMIVSSLSFLCTSLKSVDAISSLSLRLSTASRYSLAVRPESTAFMLSTRNRRCTGINAGSWDTCTAGKVVVTSKKEFHK